jgi:hypothetical protein
MNKKFCRRKFLAISLFLIIQLCKLGFCIVIVDDLIHSIDEEKSGFSWLHFVTGVELFYTRRFILCLPPYHHAIRYVFIIAGSDCHFPCAIFYVIPSGI